MGTLMGNQMFPVRFLKYSILISAVGMTLQHIWQKKLTMLLRR